MKKTKLHYRSPNIFRMKSMTDADIELQHLWLEIQTQRWQNVSRFFIQLLLL